MINGRGQMAAGACRGRDRPCPAARVSPLGQHGLRHLARPLFLPLDKCSYLVHSPVCSKTIPEQTINSHLDAGCTTPPKPTTLAPIFQPLSRPPQHKKRVQGADDQDLPAKRPRTFAPSAVRSTPSASVSTPLPDRLRPSSLDHYVGHPHLTAPDSPLQSLSRSGALGSIILWGPPGYLSPLLLLIAPL